MAGRRESTTALKPPPGRADTVPVARRDLVRRRTFLGRLRRTRTQPLMLLVAPPGYGKTSALLQWVEQDDRDAAWITVEDADNDPTRLLGRIASALGGADAAALRAMRQPTVWHVSQQVTARGAPVLVVLDDVHHLHRTPVPDLLVQLAAQLPFGSQLAVASRMVPPLRVGRLRAEGRCAEFGAADLAFDETEAAAALALTGVEIDETGVQALVERTEGWPAGVYLAAIAAKYQVDVPEAPGQISGDDAYIADYFREELLARNPPDTVRFLLRTAVLRRLSAPLCDAVLGTTDSAVRLAEIEERNLFVVPLDHRRQWYRYHRLFSEALVAELRLREPGEEQRVHRRAAAWCEQQGEVEEAVEHRVAGGDLAAAARLVNQHGAEFIGRGRIATVRRWMDALGDDALLAYPPVAVTAAWTAALSGETERAQRLLLAAEGASFPGPLPDGHRSLDAATSLLRAMMAAQGVERMLVDARHTLAHSPPGSRWNALAATVVGSALVLTGAPEEATGHLEHVARLGREQRRVVAALALAQLALLAIRRGDSEGADRYVAEARENLAAGHVEGGVTAVATYVAGADAALLRGDRESARRQIGVAVRHYHGVPPTGLPWLAAQSALVLGRVSWGLGDVEAAWARLGEARQHLARFPVVEVLQRELDELAAAVSQTKARRGHPSAMALSAAEERVLRLLPTHLSLGEIGEELHVSRNTVKTQVGAVYRKLQVTTRTEAVNSARQLGLLSR